MRNLQDDAQHHPAGRDCEGMSACKSSTWLLPASFECMFPRVAHVTTLCMAQDLASMRWAVKRGGDIKSLKLLLDSTHDVVPVVQHLAGHASSLPNLQVFNILKEGTRCLDMETAGAVSSALMLLLFAAKNLEHLSLHVPISMHLPAISSIRHLTLAVWQQDDGVVIFGCMTQRACSSLAALRTLETLTLEADSREYALDRPLDLKSLRMRSLFLDFVPLSWVDAPSTCNVHVLMCDEDSLRGDPSLVGRRYPLASLDMILYDNYFLEVAVPYRFTLSYLEIEIPERGVENARTEFGEPLPALRVLKLTGLNVHVALCATPKLQVLWATPLNTLDLDCPEPSALAGSLEFLHLDFNSMKSSSLLVTLSSMVAAGKHWSASECICNSFGDGDAYRQQVISRYPDASWSQMQQLFCHCSCCMHKDVDSKLKDCSRPCGRTLRMAADVYHAAGFINNGP